jgi:cytochrome c-type biogenesis protein CcmH/NrfG
MSKTLNLVHVLLRRAQSCHDLGLHVQAKSLFSRLATFGSLPADVADRAQDRLADLCRAEDDAAKERLHLAAALAQKPNHPEYHARMAEAYRAGDRASLEKALPHLRAALRVDPDNPRYLTDLGSLLVNLGQTSEGLGALAKAHELAGDDLGVLERYAEALMDDDQTDAARAVLKAALFRHSRDRRFHDLFRRCRFRAVADDQAAKASIPFPQDDAPVILRFAPAKTKKRRLSAGHCVVRIDGAEPLAGPSRRSPRGRAAK